MWLNNQKSQYFKTATIFPPFLPCCLLKIFVHILRIHKPKQASMGLQGGLCIYVPPLTDVTAMIPFNGNVRVSSKNGKVHFVTEHKEQSGLFVFVFLQREGNQ